MLLATMEAELDLPPILKLAFARDPRAFKGWQSMTPIQRRNHLLGIFYCRAPNPATAASPKCSKTPSPASKANPEPKQPPKKLLTKNLSRGICADADFRGLCLPVPTGKFGLPPPLVLAGLQTSAFVCPRSAPR